MIVLSDTSASAAGSVLLWDVEGNTFEKNVGSELLGSAQGCGSIDLPKGVGFDYAALHFDGTDLVFSLGENSWQLTSDHEFILTEMLLGLRRGFTLSCNDEVVIELKYWNPRFTKLLNYLDIVYDELDKEMDDFFYFLSKNCNDDRGSYLEKWNSKHCPDNLHPNAS